MKNLNSIVCVLVEYRREIRCPQWGIFEVARDESCFDPVAVLFGKKKGKRNEKRTKDGRTNFGNFI